MSVTWEGVSAALDDLEDELRDLQSRVRSASPEDDPEQIQAEWISLAQRGLALAGRMGQLGRVDHAVAAGMEAEARINRFTAAIEALWSEMLRKWDTTTLHADRRPLLRKRTAAIPGAHAVYKG